MRTAADVLRDHGLRPPSDAPGRYYTTCPKCSAKRSKPHQKSKVLGITIDSKGVRWGCNHCDWKDSAYFNGKANGHAEDDAIIETYDYVDEADTLLFQVCRKAGKQFLQRRPDGRGAWVWGTKDVRKVIYRLPEVTEAIAAGGTILIVEGEKDANTAWRLGLSATCNPSGAGKWRSEFDEVFRGADVVLIPDNDEPGWKHVNDVGAHLKNVAARVRLLMLSNAKDLSAWIDSGGSREHLDQLIASAPEWVAPIGDADAKTEATRQEDELIEALARMRPGVEFDRERKRAAKQLGVRRGAIDDEIGARRSRREETTAPLYGHWAVDPWPEVADGDALLRDIVQRIRRHVVCSQDNVLTIALWIMFAWVHDEVATHSPILNITSAEPESGKSTVLGLVSFLTPRCLPSVEISEAALFRGRNQVRSAPPLMC